MRIDRVRIQNFRLFDKADITFEPDFNVIIGVNGAGKTALLEAIAVAAGTWLLGMQSQATRQIRKEDIRIEEQPLDNGRSIFEEKLPVEVEAWGEIMGERLQWKRSLKTSHGRTTASDSKEVKNIAEWVDILTQNGAPYILPLIAYYGSGRLHTDSRQRLKVNGIKEGASKEHLMRLNAYQSSIDKKINQEALVQYFVRESWYAYTTKIESLVFTSVREALRRCIDNAQSIYYNPDTEDLVVEIEGQGAIPFSYLSDGHRAMLAMVGDLCRNIVQLNPRLGSDAIRETPGVVLIDELELHLHPAWQQRVVTDLKRTFPKIQFIATTHSPLAVGELPSRCVILLNRDGTWSHPYIGTRGAESAEILNHVMGAKSQNPEVYQLERGIEEALDSDDFSKAEKLYSRFLEITEEPTIQRTGVRTLMESERILREAAR